MARKILLVVVVGMSIVITSRSAVGAEEDAKATATTAPTIQQLRAERIEVLEQVARQLQAMYREGAADIRAVLDARKSLTAALLEAEPSADKRRELLQQQLKNALELENVTKKFVEVGRGPVADHLRAKAERLDVQIKLLKAQQER